jgi:pyruvate-formate lyase-activating enzyme
MSKNDVVIGVDHSSIEPLGMMHIGGTALEMGWNPIYVLIKDHDFDEYHEVVKERKPRFAGLGSYTGNHTQSKEAFKRLKQDVPGVQTIWGGPYPTYEPAKAVKVADFVVMSEGFEPFKRILAGQATKGIQGMQKTDKIPLPDRRGFYAAYPEFANSPIKSAIGTTGCPFKCTYCYNSSTLENLGISEAMFEALKMQFGNRLFPIQKRDVRDLVSELTDLLEVAPNTRMIYWQDDVFGQNLRWLRKFENAMSMDRFKDLRGHGQMRWEMVDPERDGSFERLDRTRGAGIDGLTLAIEAENAELRNEVLDRKMTTEVMFDGMREVRAREFTVRTEQILALPYGRTTEPTPINLDADLKVLELNVNLFEAHGAPDIAWASTYAPYMGTKLGNYSQKHGFYDGDNDNLDDSFFDISRQRFLAEWIGPDAPAIWLPESAQEEYRQRNKELRTHFNFFARTPKGHELARTYLTKDQPFSYERLGRETQTHLESLAHTGNDRAIKMLDRIGAMRRAASNYAPDTKTRTRLMELATYFAALPKGEIAIKRAIKYGQDEEAKGGIANKDTFSRAIRHHLYDEVLYDVGSEFSGNGASQSRIQTEERYPPKV